MQTQTPANQNHPQDVCSPLSSFWSACRPLGRQQFIGLFYVKNAGYQLPGYRPSHFSPMAGCVLYDHTEGVARGIERYVTYKPCVVFVATACLCRSGLSGNTQFLKSLAPCSTTYNHLPERFLNGREVFFWYIFFPEIRNFHLTYGCIVVSHNLFYK